jgi:hypothetical protein
MPAPRRRGLLAIAGSCGPLAGHHLLAGTIVVGRGELAQAGQHQRRGSIVALAARIEPAVGFRPEGTVRPPWLPLVRAALDALGFPWEAAARSRLGPGEPWTAWSGDEAWGSRGELLGPLAPP